MEILFISHKYPPTIGGMEKQSYELIRHIAEQHTTHQIVHTGEDESKFSFFWNLKNSVKNILQEYPTIQLIHLNDGLMGLFSTWLKNYTKIPVVITFHGLDLVFPNDFYQKRIQNRFTNFDAAISVSTATAQQSIKRGFSKEKVFVVPNGVDQEIADFVSQKGKIRTFLKEKHDFDCSNKKIIALLGRPVKRKGFSWFLENVLPQLQEDIVVIMIGPLVGKQKKPFWKRIVPKKLADRIELVTGGVNDEASIRQLLENPAIRQRVLQTGKVPFEQLLSLLNLADLFVMPNIKMDGDAEGFGLVALEAALCQTVVLASEIEGIPEAIQDGKNGYLLPSADAKKWTDTIHQKLENPTQLKKDGIAFQQFTLDNYSWEKMANGYIEVFEQVIKMKETTA